MLAASLDRAFKHGGLRLEFHPLAPFDGQLRRLLDRLAIETLRDWHCHVTVAIHPQPVGAFFQVDGLAPQRHAPRIDKGRPPGNRHARGRRVSLGHVHLVALDQDRSLRRGLLFELSIVFDRSAADSQLLADGQQVDVHGTAVYVEAFGRIDRPGRG